MAKNIVPYAFTPGTKAKAEEVNANFNALAELIDENHSIINSKLDEVKKSLSEDISLSKIGFMKDDLSDFPGLANCIIKAPYGVLTYDANVVTLKEGLTVLMPVGKNDNGLPIGATYTLENDVSKTFDSAMSRRYLFLCSDSTIETSAYYVESEIQPITADTVWYNTAENFMYKSDANAEFTQKDMVLIADNLNSTASSISSINVFKPLEMLFETDKERIISWQSYDYSAGISIPSGYVAPCAGRFIYIYQGMPGAGGIYINNIMVWYSNGTSTQALDRTGFCDAGQGDIVSFNITGSQPNIVFYPVKGGCL